MRAGERFPGEQKTGLSGLERRTMGRLGMGAREARSPHAHVDTVAPGEGALSGHTFANRIWSASPPDPVSARSPPPLSLL